MAKKATKKRNSPRNGKPAKKRGATKPKPDQGTLVAVPIEREFPADQVPIFANHFVIQQDGPEFYLMFFQTRPPLIIADNLTERNRQLEKLKVVKSLCVCKVVMSAGRIPDVIHAMQSTLEKHQQVQEITSVPGK